MPPLILYTPRRKLLLLLSYALVAGAIGVGLVARVDTAKGLIGGSLLILMGVIGLVRGALLLGRRRPILEIHDDGLHGADALGTILWSEIVGVRIFSQEIALRKI